jgi:hypothetical protein
MTYKSELIVASVFLLSTLLLEPAFADSTRCGSHVISSGQRQGTDKYEVLKKCGEPTTRAGNIWIYKKSGGRKTVMVFDALGKLASIEK